MNNKNNNKNKNKKLIITLLSIFLIVITSGLIYAGNYFVDYAFLRKPIDNEDPLSPSYTVSPIETINKDKMKNLYEQWSPTVNTQEVHLISEDNLTLWGKQYNVNKDSNKWLIGVHGYTSNSSEQNDIAYTFGNQGYNVITPDLRSHGKSDGNYMTMGSLDAKDILLWIDYIIDLNTNAEIVLHGVSMGGATVMMTAGEPTLPKNVIAVIEDCGYTDALQMMSEQLKARFNLPSFPILNVATIVARVKAGFDPKKAKPIDAIKNASVPILFIHGDKDGYVLPYMLDDLYNSYNGEKEKLIIEGADHAAARNIDPDLYYSSIFNFINKYSNN
ncbi:MAG: alpha/beta hydrolase [Oscillospiraceae bacterium]